MQATAAPRLLDLLRALRRPLPAVDEVAAPFRTDGQRAYLLSQSAWSLALIAGWLRDRAGAAPCHFWVPDYFCNTSLGEVRRMGVELTFYPVGAGLEVDWARCAQLAAERPPSGVVLVHYFGNPADTTRARAFCSRHRAILIEDCAHVALPTGRIGADGDFVLFSPHKVLPVPPIALLLARWDAMRRRQVADPESETAFETAVGRLPRGPSSQASWLARREISAVIPGPVRRRLRRRDRIVPEASLSDAGVGPSAEPGMLAQRLLGQYLGELEARAWSRVEKASLIRHRMPAGLGRARVICPDPCVAFPYGLGLRFDDESAAQRAWQALSASGLSVSAWADLPPEVSGDPERHAEAIRASRTTIFLGLHDGMGTRALERRLPRATGSPAAARASLEAVSADEWSAITAGATMHLPQSPMFAEARAGESGATIERLLVRVDGVVIAAVSAIVRRVAGAGVVRINRGPVWLAPTDAPRRHRVIRALAHEFRLRRGSLLLIAPDLEMTDEALVAMREAGLARRRVRPYRSVVLDLARCVDELREGLDRKWRNQLKAAERDLHVEATSGEEAFEWLVSRHAEFLRFRRFAGPEPSFLRRLRAAGEEDLLVLRARRDDRWVSGVLMARHGASCTYVIGWTSEQGRRHQAGNVLLWQGLLAMKARGCVQSDLGGINPFTAPGIAAFKRGAGGREVVLVGEYANVP